MVGGRRGRVSCAVEGVDPAIPLFNHDSLISCDVMLIPKSPRCHVMVMPCANPDPTRPDLPSDRQPTDRTPLLTTRKDVDEDERSEGFWREFFLLRPDRAALRRILDGLGPVDMLALEDHTRELFSRAVAAVKSGQGVADLHALDVSLSNSLWRHTWREARGEAKRC